MNANDVWKFIIYHVFMYVQFPFVVFFSSFIISFQNGHSDHSTNEGVFSDDIPETWLCPKCITANTPEPPLYKLRPIVRRTLVTTNKGKNGLIELPYSDPAQQHHMIQQQQQQQQQHYHMYGHNPNSNLHYTDPYEVMENEAKKVRNDFIIVKNSIFRKFSVVFTRICIQRMVILIHLLCHLIHHR